jgi:hypothetical protein
LLKRSQTGWAARGPVFSSPFQSHAQAVKPLAQCLQRQLCVDQVFGLFTKSLAMLIGSPTTPVLQVAQLRGEHMQPSTYLFGDPLGQPAGCDEVETGPQALIKRIGLLELALREVLLQLGELVGELFQALLGVLALRFGPRLDPREECEKGLGLVCIG